MSSVCILHTVWFWFAIQILKTSVLTSSVMLVQKIFWSFLDTVCVLNLNRMLASCIIQYDSGNRGSLRVCCWIFLAWMTSGRFSPQCWRRVPLLTGFCSKCVCQLRPQFWCLEDMNKFLLISYVTSYDFGNRSGIWCFYGWLLRKLQLLPFSKGLGWKKSLRERDVRVLLIFLFLANVEAWVSTDRKLHKQKLFVPFWYGWLNEVQFFRGLFSNPFHGL